MQPTNNKTQNTLPVSHLPFLIGNQAASSRLPARPHSFLWKYPTLTPPTSTVLVAEGWHKDVAEAKRFDRTMELRTGLHLLPFCLLRRAYPTLWPETSRAGVAEGGCSRWDRRRAVGIRVGVSLFSANGFHLFSDFLLFIFCFFCYYFRRFFFFFLLRQGQNRHPMSIFVNQGPQ